MLLKASINEHNSAAINTPDSIVMVNAHTEVCHPSMIDDQCNRLRL